MNKRKFLTACIALVALCISQPARAEVSLLADLVVGAGNSDVVPVGRLGSDLLMVAKSESGKTDLLISRAPTGTIFTITTLSNTPTTTLENVGAFFTVPSGFADAGTNWFTDGTAEGTIPVPFSKERIFQRNGAEVYYIYGGPNILGRFNMATGRRESSFISGHILVSAIIDGVPFGVSPSGVVYEYNFANGQWEDIFNSALEPTRTYAPVYAGENHDRLYFAAAEVSADSTYVHYVYQVISSGVVNRNATLEVADYPKQVNLTVTNGYWTFSMVSPYGHLSSYNIERPQEPSYPHDAGFTQDPYAGTTPYTGVKNTKLESSGFVARNGRLLSFPQFYGSETPHEMLVSQQESITVRALRIVGDTLLIFGWTPSRGSEVWSTPTDSCPSDMTKLYPAVCGCGVSESDSDRDGTPNCLDACPSDPTKIAAGACGCGKPDLDSDGDGVMSCVDLCPLDPSKSAPGACGCGLADTDSDGDGTPNCKDTCGNDANKIAPGVCGCGIVDADSDRDGTMDCHEQCPASGLKTVPGVCGCDVADTDTDRDGAPDCIDLCRFDSTKVGAGACGCGVPDTDADRDGTPGCLDQCPWDSQKTLPGITGCGVSDTDSDGDSVPDASDLCPVDLAKTSPGVCGCNASEQDSDNDGHPDCHDQCSTDNTKSVAGRCGCGVTDTDTDGDFMPDCFDLCPLEPTLFRPTETGCQPPSRLADSCPFDPAKLVPGSCGCGVSDTDADLNGVADCHERMSLSVEAPVVSARSNGKTRRLRISMTNTSTATYQVEATRLDKKGLKAFTKTFRSSAATITGIPTKSRWSIRYRINKEGRVSSWSSPTQVRVK